MADQNIVTTNAPKSLVGAKIPAKASDGSVGYINAPYNITLNTPVIYAGSGTFNATGQLTLTTALPAAINGSASVYLLESNGVLEGLYAATFTNSATVCQLTEVSTTTPGAYTGGTGSKVCATFPIDGGSLGDTGFFKGTIFIGATNNANSKSVHFKVGETTISSTAMTNTLYNSSTFMLLNRGAEDRNIINRLFTSVPGTGTTNYHTYTSINTANDFDVTVSADKATATDNVVIEAIVIEVYPTVAWQS